MRRPQFNANSAYPLVHEATLPLIAGWLKYKRQHGSPMERSLYRDMGLVQFVQRLLEKRALQFYGSDDRYCLIDGSSGNGDWEHVGTEQEKEPLVSFYGCVRACVRACECVCVCVCMCGKVGGRERLLFLSSP
jgi:hypothetical protein